ncbi:MAG: hypothetical protein WC043_10115 [Pseudobdellovibrionaceae bacterium]
MATGVHLREAWGEFALVHFKSKHLSDEVKAWAQQTPFAALESCARQVWAGAVQTFEQFPFKTAQQEMTLLHGQDAYRYALELLVGLKSERIGENHVVCQFREKWDQFAREHPDLEQKLKPVQTALEKDNALVRSAIIDHMVPCRYAKAVQIVSGQTKGEHILVAGHMTKTGAPSDDTKETILFLGNNRNGRPLVDEIAVIAPSREMSHDLAKWVEEQKDQKRLHPQIVVNTVAEQVLNIAVEVYDRIYYTSTMGKFPELEDSLRTTWANRFSKEHTLTLLRGDPAQQGSSNAQWAQMEDDQLSLPEDIWNMLQKIRGHNDHLAQKAQEMINYCAQSRTDGITPNGASFKKASYTFVPSLA